MSDFRLVLVEWLDATTLGGWANTPDVEHTVTPDLCQTVGWLVVEKDDFVVLAQTHGEIEMGNCWCVPKGMISRIFNIEVGCLCTDIQKTDAKAARRKRTPSGR